MRTGPKHDAYRLLLERDISAAPYVAPKLSLTYRDYWIIELTAGSGIPYHGGRWHTATSIGISARTAVASRGKAPLHVLVFENNRRTYRTLLQNLTEQLPKLRYTQLDESKWVARNKAGATVELTTNCADGFNYQFQEQRRGSFTFIFHDPNSMCDWALNTSALLDSVRKGNRVCSFHALGFNVGGGKRRPLLPAGNVYREQWFVYLQTLVGTVSVGQDCLIGKLVNDDSQWAYIVIAPEKWNPQSIDLIRNCLTGTGRDVEIVSLINDDEQKMNDIVNNLVLTREEKKEFEL